jgi:hypothetical protein
MLVGKTTRLLAGFGALAIVCGSAHATIILYEDFADADGTATRSTTPPIGPTWAGSPGFKTLDGKLTSEAGNSGHWMSSNTGLNYYDDNPGVYTLSADVFLNSSMADPARGWQIGFNNATNSSAGANRTLFSSDAGITGTPAIELNGNGRLRVKGTSSVLITTANGAYPANTWYNLKLVLDTTPTNWTFDAYVDNVAIDLNGVDPGNTYTYATNPTIRYASIGSNIRATDNGQTIVDSVVTASNLNPSYLDNFTLDVIPEPASLSFLALAGLGMLSRRSRR